MTPPRIFCTTAPDVGVAAVIRRGPSSWSHVGRWDYRNLVYEPGQWLFGTIYPQRCDLSADGVYLSYFALKGNTDWPAGQTYIAVSKLPRLTAIAAWGTGGTWTRGAWFTTGTDFDVLGDPDVGEVPGFGSGQRLAFAPAESFAVERRRGWVETDDTPPRSDDDSWDQDRQVRMTKPRPTDSDTMLTVGGGYAAQRELEPAATGIPHYSLEVGGKARPLGDVWWADWSSDGRLLVATNTGRLQCREADAETILWEHDLATIRPTG